MSTKFQINHWLANNKYRHFKGKDVHTRFDEYRWLPVDPTNGVVDYDAEHFGYEYSPTPHFLQESKSGQNNKTVLFIGDSHTRDLRQQSFNIYYNTTGPRCACTERPYKPYTDLDNNVERFGYAMHLHAHEVFDSKLNFDKLGNHWDMFVITMGHWDAGHPLEVPVTPAAFIKGLLNLTAILEDTAKPGAEIFVTTVNQHPMGSDFMEAKDWRVPPLIDMYNDQIWDQVEVDFPIKSARSFRFKNRTRTFFLDGADIMDPIWDSSTDFNHPCRYFVRPMALRVLDLFKG